MSFWTVAVGVIVGGLGLILTMAIAGLILGALLFAIETKDDE